MIKKWGMWVVGLVAAIFVALFARRTESPQRKPEPATELDRNELKLEDKGVVVKRDQLAELLEAAASPKPQPRPKTLEEALKRWNEDR